MLRNASSRTKGEEKTIRRACQAGQKRNIIPLVFYLVFAANGRIGKECVRVYQRLSEMMAEQQQH